MESTEIGVQRGARGLMRSLLGFWILGLTLGAIGMFFFDERSGNRRRHIAKDKAMHFGRAALSGVDRRARDLGHRLYGRYTEARNDFEHRLDPVDDVILVERIRSKVGRILSHPKMLHIECDNGRVHLRGFAMTNEMSRLYDSIRRVRGVKSIVVNNVKTVKDEKEMSYSASTMQ